MTDLIERLRWGMHHEAADLIVTQAAELSAMYAKHPENSCYDVPTWDKLREQLTRQAAEIDECRNALRLRMAQITDLRESVAMLDTALSAALTKQGDLLRQVERQAAEIAKYDELLDAISELHGLETRHETALRYIRAAEASRNAMLPKGVRK